MSAKMEPARRAAFFEALEATGNYSIATTRAKVSRSWVTLHRGKDRAFAADCRAAVAAAKARVAAAPDQAPPAEWGDIDGEEMVIRGGNGRRAVLARARLHQWSPRTEAVFLRALAASANVKLSAAAAGLSAPSAYVHRAKWPGFARRWNEALEMGYTRLEFAMIESACNTFGANEHVLDPDAPIPEMSVNAAMMLLFHHQNAVRGTGKRSTRWQTPVACPEKARASILRKVAAVRRARAAGLIGD